MFLMILSFHFKRVGRFYYKDKPGLKSGRNRKLRPDNAISGANFLLARELF